MELKKYYENPETALDSDAQKAMRRQIERCKAAREEKKMTLEQVSEESGVPLSTVKRFLSPQGINCRYDTVVPIIHLLLGYDDEEPDTEAMRDSITVRQSIEEFYKSVIASQKAEIEKLRAEPAALRAEFKDEIGKLKDEHREDVRELRKSNKALLVTVIAILAVVISVLLADVIIADFGWVRR